MRFSTSIFVLLLPVFCQAASMHVEVAALNGDAPLAFDSFRRTSPDRAAFSVSRLDFLLGDIALKKADGEWMGLNDWQAFISLRNGRNGFTLRGIPEGSYKAVRFLVGLPAEVNNSDAAKYPADHPLNPNLNGMHWSWQGGYIFLALEGSWRESSGRINGFSYHLATDRMLTSVELPATLDLKADHSLKLSLDVARLLRDTEFSADSTSTHSRADDPLARKLQGNLAPAFAISTVAVETPAVDAPTSKPRKVEMASTATLYRFTFPASYPRPALPVDNPLTVEGVALGKRLFEEKKLSINETQSCASCHQQETGFTDAARFSKGAEGAEGNRHAMPLVNLAWKNLFFWDGRATSLREQVLQPIQNPIEMHETLPHVVEKLTASTEYPDLFQQAFGTKEITADRIARALEQYLITLVPERSKLDLAREGKAELAAEEQRGFELFNMEYDPRRGLLGADCFHCHGGALFTNHQFANNGLAPRDGDEGRFAVTSNEADRGKFVVPTLRNVALRTHFMHDGRFTSLEQVVEHYSTGLHRSDTLDPNLAKHPDGGVPLSAEDKKALVAFLKTLTAEPGAE
jgi:cytochrome c peroxidase